MYQAFKTFRVKSSGAVLNLTFLFLLLISLWKLNLFSWNNFLICNLTCKKIFTPHTLAYSSIKWAIWHQDWQFKWEQTTNKWCRKLNLKEPQRLVQRWACIETKRTISQGMRGVLKRGGSHGIIRGICSLWQVCQSAEQTPNLCSLLYPSAPWALHKPCWSISPSSPALQRFQPGNGRSPRGGPAGWTLSNTRTQHSWILAVPRADGQSRLKLVQPFAGIWPSWAQIRVLRMQNLPGCSLPWASRISDAGERGGKNVKQDFSNCPNLCYAPFKLFPHISKYRHGSHCTMWAQIPTKDMVMLLFALNRQQQQGQWGNGSCQGKEGADLSFLHFSRARNS